MERNINTLAGGVISANVPDNFEGIRFGRGFTDAKSESAVCPAVTTLIRPRPDGRIQLSFLKSSLSPQAVKKHFSASRFFIEEPVALPACLLARFHYARKHIPAGYYPVSQNEHFYIIIC